MIKTIILLSFLQTIIYASFSGTIVDSVTNEPVKEAMVSDSTLSVVSDENGTFMLPSSETLYHIKAYGYRPYSFRADVNTTTLSIEPIHIKALYLTFWGANIYSKTVKKILKIVEQTEVNAIVIDVKNEYGSTSYRTKVKEANSYGAYKKRTIGNMKNFMHTMKSKNIYMIARIVTFKDELQASNNEDYAIKKADGSIWRNHDNMAWVDPFDKRSHRYTIAIAEDAAKMGFDEINFDYIRFPAKKGLLLKRENTQKNRLDAIESFLKLAQKRLKKYGVFISVDTYGNICWEKGDVGIGQKVESLAKYSDYLAPMLYPSGFSSGSFGFEYPSKHPHAVIYRSIKHIKDIIKPNRVRPWLQYFKDYTKARKHYKKHEIHEQMRAVSDINASGWMMWSPSSKYHIEYFDGL